MDMTPFVKAVMDNEQSPRLPYSSTELATLATMAANRYARSAGLQPGDDVWREAYLRCYDILEVQNRLNPEWEG